MSQIFSFCPLPFPSLFVSCFFYGQQEAHLSKSIKIETKSQSGCLFVSMINDSKKGLQQLNKFLKKNNFMTQHCEEKGKLIFQRSVQIGFVKRSKFFPAKEGRHDNETDRE